MFTTRKAHLISIALLVFGNSLFAGGGSGSGPGPRGLNRPGFVAPVLHVAARAMEGFVAGQEEDVITEGIHTGERKMEEPEADQSEASGGDEDVFPFPLEDLPPEVIVYHLVPYLGDRELGRLAFTSHWAAELVWEELEKRYTAHRIHQLAQGASNQNHSARSHAAQEVGTFLASSEIQLTHEQVVMLLSILIGGIGHVGMAGDENSWVRQGTTEAIGRVLASGECSEEGRSRLLDVLIGNDTHRGLAGDRYHWVRSRTAETVGRVLASGACSESERSRLLNILIGDDTHRGLAEDEDHWVHCSTAEAIGRVLVSGACSEEGRSRLLDALIGEDTHQGLARDGYHWVRSRTTETVGLVLASGACSESERSRLLDALIGDGRLVGDLSTWVRISAAEAIRTIFTSGICEQDECSRLLGALNFLTKDPDYQVRNKVQKVQNAIEAIY